MAVDIYGTSGNADTYHSDRGNTAWAAASSGAKASALILASEWIDYKYGSVFPSWKTGQRAQIREWPRVGVVDWYGYPIASDAVPREIEYATYEVALRQIGTPGSLDTDGVLSEAIKSVSVTGAISVQFAGAVTIQDMQLIIPIVDKILAPIMTGINSNASSLSAPLWRV